MHDLVKKIEGDKVDASVLTTVGAEPHDFDPTIQQIQNTQYAAVVYSGIGIEARWINKVDPKFVIGSGK